MHGIQLIWHGHAVFEIRAADNMLIDPFSGVIQVQS
jgi:L-ascorbate metabolism protein UlaG (beta-lactamase superfamily)